MHKHPEILKVDYQGIRAYIGVREHTCYTSGIYNRYCARVIEKMAVEFKDYPNLFAWQLDNEIGQSIFSFCYCEECKRGFRAFLKKKYGTVEKLNKAWGNTFWSLEYSNWDQVEPGEPDKRLNPSQVFESQLYRSQSMIDYMAIQTKSIRKYCPGIPITTNNFSPLGDRHAAFKNLDVASGDFYISPRHSLSVAAMMSDRYRCFKQDTPAWLLEITLAPWRPGKNLLDFLMWQFVARGHDVQVYFHWRTHPAGKEKINPTFISFGNKKTDSFHIIKAATEKVISTLDKYGILPQPRCEAAVIYDFNSDWIFIQGETERFDWMNNGHQALLDL